ncbi:hypothetical protein KFL_000490060 [Klebsormidium nitens]|uniref:Uncharacterized protein n=1 Tax=Klebsormidium nitens TaxID=105231 RepID=A0A0U9HTR5_KLENI|nr:hypothetical protein KFL_000490060 [Klebsormidium nitens]|eukprot:GAQ80216.1 hypothetical protein KFL_000490060 [Klebsormidium nitens]
MDQAWTGNPFAQQKSVAGARRREEWDDIFSGEDSEQVVYENDGKANLISIYKKTLQADASRPFQVPKESSSWQRSVQKDTANPARRAWEPTKPVSSGANQDDTVQQGRRPSLDPVGSFDSPVGWDDAPQEEFDTLIHRQPYAFEPPHQPPQEAAREHEPSQSEFPQEEQSPEPVNDSVTGQDGQPGLPEKGRSFLDRARDTWARPPTELDQATRVGGFTEDPFREVGSLGMGWSQQSDQPARTKSRKAAQRPKFSIRPQHRPSLTQAKANVGAGLVPLAQRLKELAESSEGSVGNKKALPVRPTSYEEEAEQDDIEDQAYHFAENEATAYRADDRDAMAEDIDVDEVEPGSPEHEAEPPAPLDHDSLAVVPVDHTDVRQGTLAERTQAGTSGRDLTSQFRNALHAAEEPQSALATQADWGSKQPVGVLAQLQRALQRQRNQEALFAKALQTGQALDHDARDCLDVRILDTSMEAHLLKCTCEVLQEPQNAFTASESPGETIFVLFNRKSHSGAVLEPGRVVRIHPPWHQLIACGSKKVVFNTICCHNLQ